MTIEDWGRLQAKPLSNKLGLERKTQSRVPTNTDWQGGGADCERNNNNKSVVCVLVLLGRIGQAGQRRQARPGGSHFRALFPLTPAAQL